MTPETILQSKQRTGFYTNEKDSILDNSIFQAETICGGVAIIEQLSNEWIELCKEGASNEPFFRPEWFRSFVKYFEDQILLLTVRKNGKLKAILPLVHKKEMVHEIPATKLSSIFNLQSQRFDLIHTADENEKDEILKILWKEIKRQTKWSVFETRLTYKKSWLNDLLKLAESENYKTGVWEMDAAPFVTLPSGENKEKLIEDYFQSLSKNRRKLLNRNMRRLQEKGEVKFKLTQGYSKDLIEKYFALEAQSWKAEVGTDVNSDERIAQLHDDFARECADKDALFIHELKLDGKTIAMYISIAFEENRTVGWKMSFDEEHAQNSPGNLLFKEVLSECMRRNSTELDMLSPANYNKNLFASGTREHAAFYIFQNNFIGKFMHFWKFTAAEKLRDYKQSKIK